MRLYRVTAQGEHLGSMSAWEIVRRLATRKLVMTHEEDGHVLVIMDGWLVWASDTWPLDRYDDGGIAIQAWRDLLDMVIEDRPEGIRLLDRIIHVEWHAEPDGHTA